MGVSGQDLRNELTATMALLKQALEQSSKRGVIHAEAEQAYQIAKMKATLIEKDKGTTGVVLNNIIKGLVAKELFERDTA